jgi:hypothetical protein
VTVLNQVYASGGDLIIMTIALECPAWDAPILICNGFDDQAVTLENGQTAIFTAAGIDISLPKKSSNGSQAISFAIDNITGEAQRRIEEALEAGERVTLTFRQYLESDLSAPAESPYVFIVRGGRMNGTQVQIQAAFYDMINTRFPRDLYTLEFAPGTRYL